MLKVHVDVQFLNGLKNQLHQVLQVLFLLKQVVPVVVGNIILLQEQQEIHLP